jgi:uncharacterized protein (DUF362 family)
MRNVTRREFLGHTAATGLSVAAGVAATAGITARADAASTPRVVVAQGADADPAALLLISALAPLGGIAAFVKPGQWVAIKPNATWAYPPGTASSTDPELLRALITLVRAAGAARITIIDHCTLWSSAESLQVSGIGQVVTDMRVEGVFADRGVSPREIYTTVEIPGARYETFRKMSVIKAAAQADVRINMAVAKSHLVTKYTLCLKHMMGFLESPGGLHAQLEQGIVDINTPSPIQAQLHILEAIRVRLKGQAGGDDNEITNPKKVRRFNQLLAGTDPALIDAYGLTHFFAVKPAELLHVKLAGQQGLGEIDVDQATAAGRLISVQPGAPTPTPTATLTPTAAAMTPTAAIVTPTPTITPTSGPPPTATPLPVATAEADEPTRVAPAPVNRGGGEQVINPNPFLSGALIPVAAIVAGVGLVARRRTHATEDAPPAGGDDGRK